jgi:hypothetical protein
MVGSGAIQVFVKNSMLLRAVDGRGPSVALETQPTVLSTSKQLRVTLPQADSAVNRAIVTPNYRVLLCTYRLSNSHPLRLYGRASVGKLSHLDRSIRKLTAR